MNNFEPSSVKSIAGAALAATTGVPRMVWKGGWTVLRRYPAAVIGGAIAIAGWKWWQSRQSETEPSAGSPALPGSPPQKGVPSVDSLTAPTLT